MENMTALLAKPVQLTATVSVMHLRDRKKQLKAELDSLVRQSSALGESASTFHTDASALTFDRERELCCELADVISLIRAQNARKRRSRTKIDMAATIDASIEMTPHIDPFFEAPIDITSCVTNCDSDCVTNCTSGCTLACDSDCRTGCTSGCTFSNSGSNTGSYNMTPMITADGQTDLQSIQANHFSIEWN
jgi:hypothetical protein